MQMRAQIRGAGLFGRRAVDRSRRLWSGQRLILSREPANRADRNAIIVHEIMLNPVGYVAREVAADVAPLMDKGDIWLAAVLTASLVIYRAGRPRNTYPVALLWRLPPQIIEKQRHRSRLRTLQVRRQLYRALMLPDHVINDIEHDYDVDWRGIWSTNRMRNGS